MVQISFTLHRYLKLFDILNPEDIFTPEEIQWMDNWISGKNEMQSENDEFKWSYLDETDENIAFTKPMIDTFVCERLNEKGIKRNSIWPNNAPFAVNLAHDVDRVESYSPKTFLRNLKKRKHFSDSVIEKVKLNFHLSKTAIKARVLKKKTDPLWCYQKWVDLEKSYGCKSSFFFFVRPEKEHLTVNDCDYLLSDQLHYRNEAMTVSDLIKKFDQKGIEIGIHGSIATSRNSELLKEQTDTLSKVIGKEVTITRQHYLEYSLPFTLNTHIETGLKIDSSMGFNRFNGYRLGTCFPVYLGNEKKNLLEIPLIIMDSTIFLVKKMTLEEAKQEIDLKINEVRAVGGCLSVNFHPDYIDNNNFVAAYTYLLNRISAENSAVLSMNEIKLLIEKICVE